MSKKKYGLIFISILTLIIIFLLNLLFKTMDAKLSNISINDNYIKIINSTYKIEDITKVELLDKVTLSIGSGSNTPNTNNGFYKVNDDSFKSKVCIYNKISPFIKITTDNLVIVFNTDNRDKTVEFYNKLIKLTK